MLVRREIGKGIAIETGRPLAHGKAYPQVARLVLVHVIHAFWDSIFFSVIFKKQKRWLSYRGSNFVYRYNRPLCLGDTQAQGQQTNQ